MNPHGRRRLSTSLESRIDKTCDVFEAAWKENHQPSIKDQLAGWSEPGRSALLHELILIDATYRRDSNIPVNQADYEEHFPDQREAVAQAFSVLAALENPDPGREHERSDRSQMPERIGRYQVIQFIAKGGFGSVYLAYDQQLNRRVAVKLPRIDRANRKEQVEGFLAEAEILANLDHPNIVPVYDAGQADDGRCYLVSKWIDGTDLADPTTQESLPYRGVADQIAKVADALQYAHSRKLVHRDVKPGNILIDAGGEPYVADFGLALSEEQFGRGAPLAGTPPYMSPEQARGEGHLVDGRSDIFSLGIILYELLSGERPFTAPSQRELLERIGRVNPRPPRQLVSDVPKELERICLKALEKRASDRYTTAMDMAEDLRQFLNRPTEKSPPMETTSSQLQLSPAKVIPKGLRSFDQVDADFFLRLLPGPRDRDGLPASLRFWKRSIEETDPDATFRVGVVYGPSGCGKSSLIKAGLLPHLSGSVEHIYIEADGIDDEQRLLRGIRKKYAAGNDQILNLADALSLLRMGYLAPAGVKTLIVLDQFEQWLHAHRAEDGGVLIQALRQCDGERVQCLLLARDDFWMGITRVMRQIEERVIEGFNSAAVDLFDPLHARKVLAEFGRSFDRIPESESQLTPGQRDFLDQATKELTRDGRVIPVRLALFAEMVKGKPWTPATLKHFGGADGVTITFLEDTFSSETASLEHRVHQRAARAVLAALLPDSGVNIKGHMRSNTELLQVSGYDGRPEDFTALMRVLDGETRLLTPIEPETDEARPQTPAAGGDTATGPAAADGKFYHLTHDYIVQPLRVWLTRKQQETRRGRAALLLTERSELWNAKPENRRLPSWVEYLTIRAMTQRRDWTDPQNLMMRTATSTFVASAAGLLAILLLLAWLGFELRGYTKADALVRNLNTADTLTLLRNTRGAACPDEIAPFLAWGVRAKVARNLRELWFGEHGNDNDQARRNAAIMTLYVEDGLTSQHVDCLHEEMLSASPDLLQALRGALRSKNKLQYPQLWSILESPEQDPGRRLRAMAVLAADEARDKNTDRLREYATLGLDCLLSELNDDPTQYYAWIQLLRPAGLLFADSLGAVLTDRDRGARRRMRASDILADFSNLYSIETLTELLVAVDSEQFTSLVAILENRSDRAIAKLRERLHRTALTEEQRELFAQQGSRAAIALLRLGDTESVWPLMRHSPDCRLRSYIVNQMGTLELDRSVLVTHLREERDVSIRRALILGLGPPDRTDGPNDNFRELISPMLLDWYANDTDRGIHGAIDWLCRQWGQASELASIRRKLATGKPEGQREWYVTRNEHQTMVVLDPTEPFFSGPGDGQNRVGNWEEQVERFIPRKFAIASKEVQVRQLLEKSGHSYRKEFAPSTDCAAIDVSWLDAARYCNWLSAAEGISKEQWCYLIDGDQVALPVDYLRRTGYRLPTEAEWEYACRAGAVTSRYFGETSELLRHYEWYNYSVYQSQFPVSMPTGLLKPNDFGLFDMLGNVAEWCQERAAVNEPDALRLHAIPVKDTEDVDMQTILFYCLWPIDTEVRSNERRQIRGGKFSDSPIYLRCSHRTRGEPNGTYHMVGFRVARTLANGR